MGREIRRVVYSLDPVELPLAVALLEMFEQHVLQFSSGVPPDTDCGPTPPPVGIGDTHECKDERYRLARYRILPTSTQQQLLTAVRFTITNFLQEVGLYPDVVDTMAASLQHARYQDVDKRRISWRTQRRSLQERLTSMATAEESTSAGSTSDSVTTRLLSETGTITRPPRVHFVTYSSDDGPGLQNLLFSAKLAGINITVGTALTYIRYYAADSKESCVWDYRCWVWAHNTATTAAKPTRTGRTSTTAPDPILSLLRQQTMRVRRQVPESVRLASVVMYKRYAVITKPSINHHRVHRTAPQQQQYQSRRKTTTSCCLWMPTTS
jgi:hypothetical protein